MRLLCTILFSLLLALPGLAQTIYGSLAGTITDPTGGVIVSADVVVRSLDQGTTRETKTDTKGFYRVPSLPPGRYALEVSFKGFEKIIRAPLVVEASVERAVDVALKPSTSVEVVTVTEEAPLIESTKSQISRGVEGARILELPGQATLNTLALMMPGAAPNNNGRPGSGFVVNGARSRSNNFMLDGANNNDQSLSIPRQDVAPEYLGEFRIITNNFSAEYGRNSGSVVMQNTKSGTNEFHGIARWTWLGNGLDSLTTNQQRTFNSQKAAGRTDMQALRAARGVTVNNQVLVSGGGPIVKNKAFFFGGYDLDRFRSTAVPIATTISQAGFDVLTANQTQFAPGSVDYLKKWYPVANDPTSQGAIAVTLPDGRRLDIPLAQYNRGAGAALSYARDIHRGLARGDWRMSDKDNLQLRFVKNDNTDPGSPAAFAVNQLGSILVNYNATVNYIRIWRPTTVMETRLTYGRREANFIENFPPQFAIGGLPTIGNQNYPQGRTDNLYELTNNWSDIHGSHTLRYGFNFLQYRLGSFFAPSSTGVINYPSLSDLLFDRNASFSQYAGTGSVPAKTNEWQTFIADDWRLSSSFTLNYGIRYEYTSAPFGFFSNASADKNNWAPRFGFAWSPKADQGMMGKVAGGGKFVVRGGYAISYDQVFQNILLNNSRNYPRGVTVTLSNLSGARLWNEATRPAPPKPEDYRGDPNLLPVRLFSPNKSLSQPYSQQFSLGIERQIATDYVFKLFYVGTRGLKLVREVEQNLGFYKAAVDNNPSLLQPVVQSYGMKPTRVSNQDAFRVDPTKGSILVGDGYAQSSYHSMQLTVEKRFSKGFQIEGNYTWSSFINDSDDILGGQANRTLPSVPFNLRLDRGRSGYDQPHRFVLNGVYQIPQFFDGKGVWGRIVDGWQISGISTMAKGTPFSILNGLNPLGILPGQIGTVDLSQRAVFNPSGVMNTGTSPSQPNPMWIAATNNSAVIGAGANIRRVGTTYNTDLALAKTVRIAGERQSLQFRWELFNLFNHRNFTVNPTNTVNLNTNNTTFMNLGFQNVSGRTMQFLVRYNF
ncbi:MAG: TonB-dependent receptor [Bryobacter sp.]|nr:TonB-dependent receptor [Bryobacter sp.]